MNFNLIDVHTYLEEWYSLNKVAIDKCLDKIDCWFYFSNYYVGLTVFRGIQAVDKDKPNTANSELSYGIITGNDDKKFSIEGMYFSFLTDLS